MVVRMDDADPGVHASCERPAGTEGEPPGGADGRPHRSPGLATTLFLLTAAMALTTLVLAVLNGRTLSGIVVDQAIAPVVLLALTFSAVGALLGRRRPENPLGWIFCAAALLQCLIVLAEEYATYALITDPGSLPLGAEASWLKEWIWAPGLGLIMVFLPLLFPDGRPPSRGWWAVAWVGGGAIALLCVVGAVPLWPARGPALLEFGGAAEYVVAPAWASVSDTVAFPLLVLAALGAVVSLFLRFRRARGGERQQIKWFLSAAALTLAFTVLREEIPASGGTLDTFLAVLVLFVVPSIPIATGIAVLEYRLYDIDLVINRALVYGVLVAGVSGLYVVVVGYVGALLSLEGDLVVSLVATGVVAVLFAPVRERVQRAVNRLMYGQRDDPYAVLSALSRRLETTLEPRAVLAAIADTVARALKLPHVAIELRRGEGFEVEAEVGVPVGRALRRPLVYGSEQVGRIVLSPRGPLESFGPADERLIDDLARQAGVAVHAVRLTTDLQRSRERLVTAREEERRRLRRTLHDGLGPALSSAMLKLGAARRLLPPDCPADSMIVEVREDMRATVADVRALAYELRPPALDQLGLVLAIHDHVERVRDAAPVDEGGGMEVDVDAPEPMPPLSAAVEVAAFHIAREALTNATRHAGARSCRVHLEIDGPPGRRELVLQVRDDGSGLPAGRTAGVGLHSMREWAEELGGTLSVESSGLGTRIEARLPAEPSS